MFHNMKNDKSNASIIIKLEMTKAYDRVSLEYLNHVLRLLAFSEDWIDMICRLISNNWYSITKNGTRNGFFKSTRGTRQGYQLSPSLFVIGDELFPTLMNNLLQYNFIPLQTEKKSPIISHMCYADDTIHSFSGDPLSLAMMMEMLEIYKRISKQMVNKEILFFDTS